jgi:multidrug transporter EmrE-like cation transporter
MAMAVYHLAQKYVPATVNPFSALATTYAVALVCSLAALAFGGLLAYRKGWNLSTFGRVFNALTTVVLPPFEILVFRERLSPTNGAGVALCLAGLGLLARR